MATGDHEEMVRPRDNDGGNHPEATDDYGDGGAMVTAEDTEAAEASSAAAAGATTAQCESDEVTGNPPNPQVPAKRVNTRTRTRSRGYGFRRVQIQYNTDFHFRNICMRHWNEEQPGGQGPLSEFNVYFKSLTDAGKEPFKKEQRNAQATARKAKKRANDTPSAD
ncbi:hypothetical protein EDB85DRAFT_2189822 [Lactarius pseudohatsudake]|nr:hypothetical protein EDB85DRAFT_2189822 [Lactarius pseudohatsudake]